MPVNDYLSDAGAAISSEVLMGKDFLKNLGDPDDVKILQHLYVWASPISTMNIFISYDDEDFESLGTVREYPQRFDLGYKKCRSIELKVVESSTNKRFILESYMVIGEKVTERESPKE